MRSIFFLALLSATLALRIISLNKFAKSGGDIGGISGATSLCRSATRLYSVFNTTWIPLLEPSPASLQNTLALYGSSIYPMRDAQRTSYIIATSNIFAPGAVLKPLLNDAEHWTGWGGVSTCNSWTSSSSTLSGTKGLIIQGDLFLSSGTDVCNKQKPIICVEVPLTQTLSPPVWMFVTSTAYNGNFGGLAGADSICTARANSPTAMAGIRSSGGRWFAVLADNTTNVYSRIDGSLASHAILLPGSTSPGSTYENLIRSASAPSFVDAPYNYLENGNVATSSIVWTGSTAYGSYITNQNCQNWRSTAGTGQTGNAKSNYSSVLSNDARVCTQVLPLYCMQYFCPIFASSAVLFHNTSKIVVAASIYSDTPWYSFRCVYSTTGYVFNTTIFWSYSTYPNNATFAVVDGYSSPPSTTAYNLVKSQDIFVTCAVRSGSSYIGLTWLVNVGAFVLIDKPIIASSTPFTTAITVAVMTGYPQAMQLKCILAYTMETEAFWNVPANSYVTSANSSFPNLFTFTGLIPSNYYYISCAQYPAGQNSSASTAVTTIYIRTLPKCANVYYPCPFPSQCIDTLDGTLYRCSPFIDGGLQRTNDFTNLTCTSVGGSATSLTLTRTTGSEAISFCVNLGSRNNVSTLASLSTFYYGTVDQPQRFPCKTPVFGPVVGNSMLVRCATAKGMGGSLRLMLVYDGVYISGYDAISYPLPIIYPSTLRTPDVSNASGASTVLATTACQIVVSFDVKYVEILPELQVNYGYDLLPLLYQCQLDIRTNTSTIFCSTDPSTQFSASGFFFTVNANGQSTRGYDILTLPAGRPEIEWLNATGCQQSADGSIFDCPTSGDTISAPVIITLFGTKFGTSSSFFRVFVGGETCSVVTRMEGTPYDSVSCRLPEGTGYGQSMFVQNDVFFSAPRSLVSYATPVVKRLCGCDADCINSDAVSGCHRDGFQVLDVFGKNFGREGATVLVGVDQCTKVEHDLNSPHSHLRCLLPPGSGLFRPVLVIQGNGAASLASTVTVSYSQCGFGTFQAGTATDCQNCSAGKFSSIEGLSACSDCPPGTKMADSGATACDECQAGWFQPSSAQSDCSLCAPGTFSAITSRTVCEGCSIGRYTNESGRNDCDDCIEGTYQPLSSQMECLPCALGKFQSNPGQPVCEACGKGKFADSVGLVMCESCEPGSYQNDAGGSRCDYCVPGRFASAEGAPDCIPCQPGSISVSSGVIACDPCPKGSAQASAGQSFCSDCTTGRFSGAPGLSSCDLCAFGSITPRPGAQQCVPCPPGSTPADSVCACNPNYEWTGTTCELCAAGQDCSKFGVIHGEGLALPGFLRVGNATTLFQSCLISTYCPGGAVRCAPFREGELCQSCFSGYREDSGSPDGSCSACPDNGISSGNIIGVGIILIALLVFLYYIVVRSGLRSLGGTAAPLRKQWWDSVSAESTAEIPAEIEARLPGVPTKENRVEKTLAYQLKIVITFMQLATSVIAISTLGLPPTFRTFLSAFDFVNLNFIPWNYVGCLSEYTLLTKILVTSIAPFVLLPVGGFFLFVVLKTLDRWDTSDSNSHRQTRHKYRAVFWKVTLFTVFLAYPAVSRQIFSYFRCVEVKQDQMPSVYLLRESFKEACYDTEWTRNLGVVIFLLLLYPLGVPLVLGLILRHYRPRFHERYIRYCLGFAFEGFVSEIWYFELLDMIHKLLLASIVSLLPGSSQVPVAMAILGSYLCLLIYAQPYVRKADNLLHMTSQVALYLIVFSFLARDTIGPITAASGEDILLSCLLITIFISVLLHYVFRMIQFCRLAYLSRKRRARRKQDVLPTFSEHSQSSAVSDLPLRESSLHAKTPSESTVLPSTSSANSKPAKPTRQPRV